MNAVANKKWRYLLVCYLWLLPTLSWALPKLEVKGLFKNSAIILIDGKQQLLKVGKTSRQGVTLVSATSQYAVIEFAGRQHKLQMSRAVGGANYTSPEKQVVRLSAGAHGHFTTTARVNGKSVKVLVDTGASTVSMSSRVAKQLGIAYREGVVVGVSTASGNSRGYQILLDSVSIGTVKVQYVNAIVLEGDFPRVTLLGNSFLSKVDMKVEQGVLILHSKF